MIIKTHIDQDDGNYFYGLGYYPKRETEQGILIGQLTVEEALTSGCKRIRDISNLIGQKMKYSWQYSYVQTYRTKAERG